MKPRGRVAVWAATGLVDWAVHGQYLWVRKLCDVTFITCSRSEFFLLREIFDLEQREFRNFFQVQENLKMKNETRKQSNNKHPK